MGTKTKLRVHQIPNPTFSNCDTMQRAVGEVTNSLLQTKALGLKLVQIQKSFITPKARIVETPELIASVA